MDATGLLPDGARIVRDEHGIPHIWASSVADVAFAQGVEAASSRTWQLDADRRHAEGVVAALLGKAALEWDTFARRARIAETARGAFAALDSESQDFFAAYAAGVSAAFAAGATCAELVERGVAPGAWEPWTPLAVFSVNNILFSTFPDKLWRQALVDAVGQPLAGLVVREPGRAPGSNAFVLDGSRTVSGLPIVAGDPHRLFESPNVYAQVHLACPEFDVAGFTFAGVPGVQHFAHAGSVAWAITNCMADYQDVGIEVLVAQGGRVMAQGPGGLEECDVVSEVVEVSGGAPVEIECVMTARGPVVIDQRDSGGGALSLAMPSQREGDLGLGAILPLLRARSVADVEAAFAAWVEPVNNLVVADVAGAIAHHVVGRVPVRASGRIPVVPAAPGEHDWVGFHTELPQIPPTDGVVVTANHRGTAAYDAICTSCSAPFRARRLTERLDERKQWDASGLREVLVDDRQIAGSALLDAISALAAPASGGELDASAAALVDEIMGWDRQMRSDSVTAARFAQVRARIAGHLVTHPAYAGVPSSSPHGRLYDAWFSLAGRIEACLPAFFDSSSVPVLESAGIDLDLLVRRSVTEVAAAPTDQPWGDHHRYHPISVLERLGLPQVAPAVSGRPLPGDIDCVNASGWLAAREISIRGPVARYVWDLADRDAGHWAVPLGADGGMGAPHRDDQFERWLDGTLLPVLTDWAVLDHLDDASAT
ncbi:MULTISPECIES: penicillin acylase family protein [unclassified Knoellia]|uniref:penicillin acylase family protein n=1 Tax=Knoellia altitudinis TaxID=3404795 RepID=UPI003607C5ED